MERQQDIVLGAVFSAIGVAAVAIATGYDGATAAFPTALGGLLAVLGALVALKALAKLKSEGRVLMEAPRRFATTLSFGAAYLVSVTALGFYTASFLLMITLPFALGFRRPIYACATGAIFISLVFFVFSVLLEKPLPRELILQIFTG